MLHPGSNWGQSTAEINILLLHYLTFDRNFYDGTLELTVESKFVSMNKSFACLLYVTVSSLSKSTEIFNTWLDRSNFLGKRWLKRHLGTHLILKDEGLPSKCQLRSTLLTSVIFSVFEVNLSQGSAEKLSNNPSSSSHSEWYTRTAKILTNTMSRKHLAKQCFNSTY